MPLPGPGIALSSQMPCRRLACPSRSANSDAARAGGPWDRWTASPVSPSDKPESRLGGVIMTAPETASRPLQPPGSGASSEAATVQPADLPPPSGYDEMGDRAQKTGR